MDTDIWAVTLVIAVSFPPGVSPGLVGPHLEVGAGGPDPYTRAGATARASPLRRRRGTKTEVYMDNGAPARHVLAVASGKGGVGKSTITMNMAVVLAQQGARVGLVDCDVYGPDIPAMVGLTRRTPTRGWTLSRLGGSPPIEPVERFGVTIVSTGLLFGEEQPLSWPATLIGVLVNQLLRSSVWPELDYLILDLPPGTADVTQTVFRAAPRAQAIVVVTPQEVAHLDARKLVAFL